MLGETLTTRAYRQKGSDFSIPGPTLRMEPGNKYVLQLHNLLPFEAKSTQHNVFKDPNDVNIHTHGLHISGQSPGDDVTRSFEGGFGGDFVYDIPADHMGGSYWYHAHHHGSTFLQVSGGMFGMIVVDDGNDGIPANVENMTERELVIGFLDPAAAGTGGDVLMSGTLAPTWTVNGIQNGNICLPSNEWQHWSVLLADRNAHMKTIEFGPEVEVMLLSRDGVWRTVAPKALTNNQIEISGASRADFAIRTSSNSYVNVEGTQVASIVVEGSPDLSVHPFASDGVSTWSANRPSYLRDLRNETNVNFESISMGARTVNGSKFDHHNPNLTLTSDQVQEWSLGGTVQHPFHLHIYHIQALSDDNDFEAGEFYDVVSSKMSVRFDLNAGTSSTYEGRTIMHCHILSHEDRGAMGWLNVIGGNGPPTFPQDMDISVPYSEYYSLSQAPEPPIAASGLSATPTSSASIDLEWEDNSSNETGFEIERSTDGINFSVLNSVGANITTYTDDNLAPSTMYSYRINSFNGAGSAPSSNVASATTLPIGGGLTMYVSDINVGRESAGRNRFRGVATVTVLDENNAPVEGASVSGFFSGPSSGNDSGITDGSGQVNMTSRAVRNPNGEWCFSISDVALSGYTYDAESNVISQSCESSSSNSFGDAENRFTGLSIYPNPFSDFAQVYYLRTIFYCSTYCVFFHWKTSNHD